MKRLLMTLIAAVALAGPLAGGAAHADEHGRGHGDRGDRGGREERGGDQMRGRGPPDRGYDRGGRYEGPPIYERRPEERGRYEPEPGRVIREYGPPPSPRAALGYGPPVAPRAMRRGGYMPPEYRGVALGDYGRYRLRPPPRGYAWYRVGDGYALVSIYTGQIFDMIPD